MYIEQGYRGDIGLWKFFVIPTLFVGYMAFNTLAMYLSPMDTTAVMNAMIERFGSSVTLVALLLPFPVGLLVVFGWTYLVHPQPLKALTTSRKKVDWKRIFFAFFLWGGITLIITLADVYFSPEDYKFNFDLNKFLVLAVIAVLLIPLQTSFEEYLFRGHLLQGLGLLAKNRWVPLVVTSVIFGLMHLANPEVERLGYGIMVYYIGTGFFLGIMTLMDEGLELALGFHAANNLITALLVTADWTAFQTDSIYRSIAAPTLGWDVFIPIVVIFPILLFIFSKKYGWTNWKERLAGKVLTKEQFVALQNEDAPAVQT
ncbi:MAG: CPBP family intramembrane glutamic endopeptidase [Bacteroidota bacterium]